MQLLVRPAIIGSNQVFRDGIRNRNRDFARITGFVDTTSSIVTLFLCLLAIIWDWFCTEDFPIADPVVKFAISTFPKNEVTREFELREMKPYAIAAQVSLILMYTCRLVAAYALVTGTRSDTPVLLKLISCKLWTKTAVILVSVSTAVLLFGNHSVVRQCLLIAELAFRSLGFYYVVEFILDVNETVEQGTRKDIMSRLRRERVLAGSRQISLIYKVKINTEEGHHDPNSFRDHDHVPNQENVITIKFNDSQTMGSQEQHNLKLPQRF